MQVSVLLEPCEEGGFHAWVPALPGCHSEGDTEQEALRNITEGIELYLGDDEDNLPAPPARMLKVAV